MKKVFGILTLVLMLPVSGVAADRDVIFLDKNHFYVVLCEGPIAAGTIGPWVSLPPSQHNLVGFATIPTDRTNASLGIVALTSPVTIEGLDHWPGIIPTTAATGHSIGSLTNSISSLNNTGFGYRFYRCSSAAAQPAGISIILKGFSDR